jgi:hypothetical protein
MSIERDDWGDKFDNSGNLIPADNLPRDPAETIRQIATYDPTNVAASTPATTPGPLGEPVDRGHDRHGNAIPVGNKHGLPAEVAREMHASADGYAAQLSMMQTTASRVLEELPSSFAAAFDTLSPSIQAKAYRMLRQYPHLGAYDLVDRVQATLTLSEMAEATKWVRGLKA